MVGRKCSYRLFTSNNYHPYLTRSRFSDSRGTKERASYRAIKLNSSISWEFHDESNRNSRSDEKKQKKKKRNEKRKKRRNKIGEKSTEGEGQKERRKMSKGPAVPQRRPPGADKLAATRSISRKRDGELYRSIRCPHPRLRIQLPLSAGAIYRETNGDASLGAPAKAPRGHARKIRRSCARTCPSRLIRS